MKRIPRKYVGMPNKSPWVKDAFHSALIKGRKPGCTEEEEKTVPSFLRFIKCSMEGGKSESIYLRLSNKSIANPFTIGFKKIFEVT